MILFSYLGTFRLYWAIMISCLSWGRFLFSSLIFSTEFRSNIEHHAAFCRINAASFLCIRVTPRYFCGVVVIDSVFFLRASLVFENVALFLLVLFHPTLPYILYIDSPAVLI